MGKILRVKGLLSSRCHVVGSVSGSRCEVYYCNLVVKDCFRERNPIAKDGANVLGTTKSAWLSKCAEWTNRPNRT